MDSRFAALIGAPHFRSGDCPPEEFIHINFEDGGLGDHIARLTVIDFLTKEYPFLSITVWCPKFFIPFAKKAVPNVTWMEYNLNKNINMSRPVINAGSSFGVTSMRTHLVDHAFAVIADKIVKIEQKNYLQVKSDDVDLSKFALPNPFVILTTGYTAKVREWKPTVVNAVAAWLNLNEIPVVFLGNKKAVVGENMHPLQGNFAKEIDFSEGLDLRDKTTLVEAHAIISKAKAIVGLDNGLLHVAGCTETPIVAGFTTVDPELRLPYRHDKLGWNCHAIVPKKSLECRLCQSNMNFVYDFDFTKCYYKDYKCVEEQHVEPYMDALRDILK